MSIWLCKPQHLWRYKTLCRSYYCRLCNINLVKCFILSYWQQNKMPWCKMQNCVWLCKITFVSLEFFQDYLSFPFSGQPEKLAVLSNLGLTHIAYNVRKYILSFRTESFFTMFSKLPPLINFLFITLLPINGKFFSQLFSSIVIPKEFYKSLTCANIPLLQHLLGRQICHVCLCVWFRLEVSTFFLLQLFTIFLVSVPLTAPSVHQ